MADPHSGSDERIRRLSQEAESQMAAASERLVGRDSFGEVLAMATENVVALTRIGFESLDLLWSNLRLAGRRDITRLAHQIGRTEDKLELVLQELERLREHRDRPESSVRHLPVEANAPPAPGISRKSRE